MVDAAALTDNPRTIEERSANAWIPVPAHVCNDIALLIEKLAFGRKQPMRATWDVVVMNRTNDDEYRMLNAASNHGHMAIAAYTLTKLKEKKPGDLNIIGRLADAMAEACRRGHIDIAVYLSDEIGRIGNGAFLNDQKFNQMIESACEGGYTEILEWAYNELCACELIGDNKGRHASTKHMMNAVILSASRHGSVGCAEWARKKGGDSFSIAVRAGVLHNNAEIIEWASNHCSPSDRTFFIEDFERQKAAAIQKARAVDSTMRLAGNNLRFDYIGE